MPWQVRSSSLDLSFWTAPSMSCPRCYSSHSRVGRLCVCLCVRANM
jgi:hypothetical protein